MRKLALFLPLALLAVSACGKAKNEAAEANETITGDSNTMGEAVSDVNAANAATEAAFGEAENAYTGNAVEGEESGETSNEITD